MSGSPPPARHAIARAASAVVFPEPTGPVTTIVPSELSTVRCWAAVSVTRGAASSARKDPLLVSWTFAARDRISAEVARRVLSCRKMFDTLFCQEIASRNESRKRRFEIGARARRAQHAVMRVLIDHRLGTAFHTVARK